MNTVLRKGNEILEISLKSVNPDEKNIFRNLMSLYLHDLSEYDHSLDLSKDLLIEFDVLDLFFHEEDLIALYILIENKIIGFILLQKGRYVNQEYIDYVLNSFFIIRKYRRRGFGLSAVQKLLTDFPGRYAVGQIISNQPAVGFWKSVYKKLELDFHEREEVEDGLNLIYQYFKT